MKIEYDDKFDLLYIRFDDTAQEVINERINDHIVLDIGKNEKIVGIEILGAMDVLNLSNILPIDYLNYRKDNLVTA
ncbi:MAG: hypothetical protein HW421_1709 [Ignavibacteria bacterium]|nr:hypothetical protein [Ignavibacteria bacterium]